ncbi:FG-GAP repeat domain-containing protein, partial [Methanolobus psychrotolerans]|uniref:FG-GAP repeat domain-containing protein n=1 Tax=Methanolobus psychrotolerans TaxID=1874706 RepID=UPI00101AEAC2
MISNIHVHNNGALLWNYCLGFKDNDSKSFLSNITKTGADNQSFPSTNFDYDTIGGWQSTSSWTPQIMSYAGSDRGVRFVDINGDGLDDMIRGYAQGTGGTYSEVKQVWLNTGSGWQSTSSWTPQIISYAGSDRGVRFVDINGDGLVDMIRGYAQGTGGTYSEV